MAYMIGKGHQHTGPGTSMVQFTDPNFRFAGVTGLSAYGRGLGIFDSGWDITGWSKFEWGIAIIAGYALWSAYSAFSLAGRRYKGRY